MVREASPRNPGEGAGSLKEVKTDSASEWPRGCPPGRERLGELNVNVTLLLKRCTLAVIEAKGSVICAGIAKLPPRRPPCWEGGAGPGLEHGIHLPIALGIPGGGREIGRQSSLVFPVGKMAIQAQPVWSRSGMPGVFQSIQCPLALAALSVAYFAAVSLPNLSSMVRG